METLAGVACHRIVRSHVLSFAALRQIRFGAGPDGDAACRALLAALALAALARSDAELVLRANCDLVEAGPAQVPRRPCRQPAVLRRGCPWRLGHVTQASASNPTARGLAVSVDSGG